MNSSASFLDAVARAKAAEQLDRDRAALSSRRALFARLVAERNAATVGTPEHTQLEQTVRRCARRLDRSIVAARAALRADEQRRAALAQAVPAPASMTRALLAQRALHTWCRRLKRDLKAQKRARHYLTDASDALARAAALAETLPPRRPRRRIFSALSASDTDHVYVRGGAHHAEVLRIQWQRAARAVEAARETCNYARQTIAVDAARRLAVGGGAAVAHAERQRVQDACDDVRKFGRFCREELVSLSATSVELDAHIDRLRERIARNNGIAVPAAGLPSYEDRGDPDAEPEAEALTRLSKPSSIKRIEAFVRDALVFT